MVHVMVAAASAWIFIALAAVAVLVLTAIAARAQGRHMERRMVAELGRRWDQPKPTDAMSQAEDPPATDKHVSADPAPHSPDADLQITLEGLLSQRVVLLEEFQAVQAQITTLKKRVERRRPAPVVEDEDETIVHHHPVLPE